MFAQQCFNGLFEETDCILVESFIQRLLLHVDSMLQFQFGDKVIETLGGQVVAVNGQQAEEGETVEHATSLDKLAFPC